MKTLSEFFYEQNKEGFENQADANEYLSVLSEQEEHYGDCIKQNVSCLLCEFTQVLNDYYKYVKAKHPALN
jgi:hypothetical protein